MKFDLEILSTRERIFFATLDLANEEVTTDDLVKIVKVQEGVEVRRSSVTSCIKYLQSKIAQHGWIIENTNGIGAGKIASYKMEEKF